MNDQLPAVEYNVLQQVAWSGSRQAAEALGSFSGNALTVEQATVSVVPPESIPSLLGDPEEVVVGVHFCISGDLDGYLLAYFSLADVQLLIESLIGERPASLTGLGDMELSALGEAGNIIVSSFLSAMNTFCGLSAMPSPPAVAAEMSGAILTSAMLPIIEAEGEVLSIEAEILPTAQEQQAAACRIFFLPTLDSWTKLQAAVTGKQPQGLRPLPGV